MSIKRYDPRTFLLLGRHKNNEDICRLWWSGSGVRLCAACTFLSVEAESFCTEHAVWLGVLADGAPIARFPLLPGRRSYPLLAGMDIAVPHEITILRDTQPAGDEPLPVTLHCLETDGTLESVSPRTRLIEFIGDSLTTGEGCTGPCGAEEWRTAWMCSMCTYAAYTAEVLDADKRQISVSGWGAWRSWDNDPAHRLGAVYDRLCALIPAGDIPYDFNERKADAVVINLGTNDATALRQAQDHDAAAAEFVRCAEALMAQIRVHQPDAYIVWAYGLCGNDIAPYIEQAVSARQAAGDACTAFLSIPDCNGDVGSRMHPSRAAHRHAAEKISAFLQSVWRNQL